MFDEGPKEGGHEQEVKGKGTKCPKGSNSTISKRYNSEGERKE